MTRQEHIVDLEKKIKRAKAYGDYIGLSDCEYLLADLKRLSDSEYGSYLKVQRLFCTASVKPLAPKSYDKTSNLGKRKPSW